MCIFFLGQRQQHDCDPGLAAVTPQRVGIRLPPYEYIWKVPGPPSGFVKAWPSPQGYVDSARVPGGVQESPAKAPGFLEGATKEKNLSFLYILKIKINLYKEKDFEIRLFIYCII